MPPPPPPPPPPDTPFTWEVWRGFYPEPRWPQEPSARRRAWLVGLLLAAGLLLLSAAGLYAWVGVAGATGSYTTEVHGQVTSGGAPLPGVVVTIQSPPNGTWMLITSTNGSGYFTFSHVPEGAALLQFSAAGYQLTEVDIFVAPFLTAAATNVTDLSVSMVPGNVSQPRAFNYAAFPDVETYLTAVFSTTAIEAIAGLIALWGGLSLRRARRPPRAVVGGSAAVLAPFFPLALSAQPLYLLLYPPSLALLVVAGVLGFAAVVLTLRSYHPFLSDDL